ncbi:MAG: hypothetical protein ABFD60_01775 [Bryobacteraceae bacterium]
MTTLRARADGPIGRAIAVKEGHWPSDVRVTPLATGSYLIHAEFDGGEGPSEHLLRNAPLHQVRPTDLILLDR